MFRSNVILQCWTNPLEQAARQALPIKGHRFLFGSIWNHIGFQLYDNPHPFTLILFPRLAPLIANLLCQEQQACGFLFRSLTALYKWTLTLTVNQIWSWTVNQILATVKLLTSLILSHVDCCSSLLSDLPASSVHSLQRIHNCASCLIKKCKTWPHHHSISVSSLAFNPTKNSAQYERAAIICILCAAPSYLCDRLQLYTPSHTPHSACDTVRLQILCMRLSTIGSCAFSVFSTSTWNDFILPHWKKPSLDSSNTTSKSFFLWKKPRFIIICLG